MFLYTLLLALDFNIFMLDDKPIVEDGKPVQYGQPLFELKA